MTFLTSPYEQEVKKQRSSKAAKQQSSKLFQDENAQIHLVSDLRVLQAGDVSCRFLLQMEGKRIHGRQRLSQSRAPGEEATESVQKLPKFVSFF